MCVYIYIYIYIYTQLYIDTEGLDSVAALASRGAARIAGSHVDVNQRWLWLAQGLPHTVRDMFFSLELVLCGQTKQQLLC